MIGTVATEKVKPYSNNPRMHNISEIKRSIENFGFRVPIVVDKDYVIITGHGRWQAARELQLAEIPVIVAADLDDERVTEYRIADNKVAELSGWNINSLEQELREIVDLTKMAGFQPHEIALLLEDLNTAGFATYSEEDIQKIERERESYFSDRVDAIQDDYLTLECEACGEKFSTSYRVVRDFY